MSFKFTLLLLLSGFVLTGQTIKSPSEFLGYELGTRFSRHYQVIAYYKYLEEISPGVIRLEPYGKTYEQRSLMVAYISSPENIANLDAIREHHLKAAKGQGTETKAIVWLSYNVHGNESVSTEASMQTAYDLMTKKQDWLADTVVIIDPCINPDGRDRYVNWYYQFQNTPHQVDPQSKEHYEPWLDGRSNHYMFDLNRDWVWITQKESRQRLEVYTRWLPHIHADFHEQEVDAPYYFAPAAAPLHEVITQWQREFQVTIGKNHATYFDAKGWLYFTKEVFDLFYPSYGDTYPVFNGAIGMTYEQGGSGQAGLGIITSYGDTLTLKDRLLHHHVTGLSTVEITAKHATRLISEYKKFYAPKSYLYKSYVLHGNPDKISALTNLLDAHRIEYSFRVPSTIKGYHYATRQQKSVKHSDSYLVVSTDQFKGSLVKVLFEPNARLSDSLTYDITSWSLPYAYGLDAIASKNLITAPLASVSEENHYDDPLPSDAYAYITNWDSMKDARFLTQLLKEKIRVRYSEVPFTISNTDFDRGSLIITKIDNRTHPDLSTTISRIAQHHKKSMTSTTTGYVEHGKDLGSSSVKMIPNLNIAIFSGSPASTLGFGELWHFFEQQLHYPVTVLDSSYFHTVNLSNYHVMILPEGKYQESMPSGTLESIKKWIHNGGKLIAIGGAIQALSSDEDLMLESKKNKTPKITPYATIEREGIKHTITGAVFKAKVDPTHPLAFGYTDTYFTLKLNNTAYPLLTNGSNVVYIEDENTPYSGFAGSEAMQLVAHSLLSGVRQYGKGSIIYMIDNPLYRGFWENGKLFFANAIFLVNPKQP